MFWHVCLLDLHSLIHLQLFELSFATTCELIIDQLTIEWCARWQWMLRIISWCRNEALPGVINLITFMAFACHRHRFSEPIPSPIDFSPAKLSMIADFALFAITWLWLFSIFLQENLSSVQMSARESRSLPRTASECQGTAGIQNRLEDLADRAEEARLHMDPTWDSHIE